MLKKIIPIAIALCLLFSISVMAENTSAVPDDTAAGASQQMPQGERPQGGRGNMGMPLSEDLQGRTPPNMPNGEESGQTQGGNQQFSGQMPGGMGVFPGNMQNFNGQTQEEQPKGFLGFVKTYSTPITSVVLLGLAFIFVIFYRRKNY